MNNYIIIIFNPLFKLKRRKNLKGTDRLCKVVETYQTFKRSVNPEFERKVDVQNPNFGWMFSELVFF